MNKPEVKEKSFEQLQIYDKYVFLLQKMPDIILPAIESACAHHYASEVYRTGVFLKMPSEYTKVPFAFTSGVSLESFFCILMKDLSLNSKQFFVQYYIDYNHLPDEQFFWKMMIMYAPNNKLTKLYLSKAKIKALRSEIFYGRYDPMKFSSQRLTSLPLNALEKQFITKINVESEIYAKFDSSFCFALAHIEKAHALLNAIAFKSLNNVSIVSRSKDIKQQFINLIKDIKSANRNDIIQNSLAMAYYMFQEFEEQTKESQD